MRLVCAQVLRCEMTILHIITRLILGGAQQNTVLCCRHQVQSGHRVVLAYGPIYGPEGSLLEEARASGAELVEIYWLRRAILPVHDVMCYAALRRLIRRVRPEVVHTHSSKAGILGRAAAWAEKVPAVVHTVHGLPFHARNPAWLNALYVELERWAARRCHAIVGVSQAMCQEFLKRGIGRAEQFYVVPSGMEVEAFESLEAKRAEVRRRWGIPAEAPVVGIVARVDRMKGQEDLIEILPGLRERYPELRLLIVGDGWYRKTLEGRVRERGLEGAVVFTGLVPPGEVPGLLAVMDVHALPSYQEGQPRTLVQALLAGCAIVGYDAGGIRDVCRHEETGLLVPLGDRQGLAEAIDRLLSNAELRRRLAEDGRRWARQNFDARIMFRRLDELYERLLSGKMSRAGAAV